MKIGLVIEFFQPAFGGAETSTAQFSAHLKQMGHQVHIFTRDMCQQQDGLTLHQIKTTREMRSAAFVQFTRMAEEAIAAEKCDVIHSMIPIPSATVFEPRGGLLAESIQRNIARRKTGWKRFMRRISQPVHFKQQVMLRLERQLLERKDPPVVVAVSDYVVRQLREHYDFPLARVHKVFNGVDISVPDDGQRGLYRQQVRECYHVGPDELLVVCIAHNFALKGVGELIDAIALARRQLDNLGLLIVGAGRGYRYVRQAKALGLCDIVRFAGASRQIERIYAAADIVALPTFYDPCSRVILEAAALGLPTITTRFNGAAEVLENGKTGLVLDDPHDVSQLSKAICDLANPQRRARMGAAAANLANTFTMAQHASSVTAIYDTLVTKGSAA